MHDHRRRRPGAMLARVAGLAIALIISTLSPAAAAPTKTALSSDQRVGQLLSQMTLDEKISMITGVPDPEAYGEAGYLPGVPRLGIPPLRLADGQAGVNGNQDATALPLPLGLAATFSRKDAQQYGTVIGRDAKALGMNVELTQHINIDRDPLFGRNPQTYGEDPYLSGQLGAANIIGMQSQGTMAVAKHLAAFNQDASPFAAPNVIVDERTLQEIYLPAFQAAVNAGVASIMCSYNRLNGPYACEQPYTLTNVLRDQWGFSGFVVSDWGANHSTTSINAGLDMEMPGYAAYGLPPFSPHFDAALKTAVQNGTIPMSVLDQAVSDVLSEMDRFGLLTCASPTGPVLSCSAPTRPLLPIQDDAQVARNIADEAAVLLKDDNHALPLTLADLQSLALIGPTAGQLAAGYPGGERAYGFPDREISPLSALQQLAPDAHISYAVGDDLTGVPVPSSALTPPSGTGNGLLRTQTTPNTGATQVDPQIDFLGADSLPAGTAYTWTSTLTVPTTGTYALMLQTASGSTGSNPPVFNRGSITVDGNTVASGARIELNGGRSKNWSSLLPTTDGLDNARGTVDLTAGAHQIKVTATAVGTDPLGVRLNWVTPEMAQVNIDLAAKVARAVHTPVVFAWSTGGGSSLSLPDTQDALIEAVAAANPRTIVVLNTGFAVTMPWLNSVQSVLEMWDPGQEGGWATADVLLGKANPSGHLPITFPQSLDQTAVYAPSHPERSGQGVNGVVTYSESLDVGYRWFDAQEIPPLFPFGYGLSYTTFSFSHLQTTPTTADGTQEIRVSFDVSNTGGNAGAEVAQVYLGLPASAGEPPKRLVGFERVQLAPGQTQHVTVTLDPAAHPLSSWNTDTHNWAIADGDYTVYLGDSSRTVALTDTLHIHHAG